MPFTISHAAAALPLRRLGGGQLPLAALMIGAMAPDFAYFASFGPERVATHNFAGLFWFCWPVGLAAWLVFTWVLERPTVALLPQPWRAHFTRPPQAITPRLLALASLAVILGGVTHLAWDSFTHGNTPVSNALPVLHQLLFTVYGIPVRVYWFLQILSSLIGALVLLVWAIRAPRTSGALPASAPSPIPDLARAAALATLLGVGCCVGLMSYYDHIYLSFESRVFFLSVSAMKGAAITWVVIAVFVDRYLRVVRLAPAPIT